MTACTQNIFSLSNIKTEVEFHPAWLGFASGLKAEKLLRNRNAPYLYVLRKGEHEDDFYVTFIDRHMTIRHQPFTLTTSSEGWCYENWAAGGPFKNCITIDDVIHLIMHCEKEECRPLINFQVN